MPKKQNQQRDAASEYTKSFGQQWNRYRITQIDKFNGTTLSKDRFFGGTGWSPEELVGQKVLEVGCGAGRFTQILLDAGANVYALDASAAVHACYTNNGSHPRLHIVQADLYAIPFREGVFDRVFCYGVLQHTPNVKRAFLSLIPFLRRGGLIAIDVYNKRSGLDKIVRWESKRLWRPLTTRLPPGLLSRLVEFYIPLWTSIDSFLERIPVLGRLFTSIVPCWNYKRKLPLTDVQLKEWAILDTFDALSAKYDSPQRIEDVKSWFGNAGLIDVNVRFGGNGILGNGRKPDVSSRTAVGVGGAVRA